MKIELAELQELVSVSKQAYEKYEPYFHELTNTYHLVLDSLTQKSLKQRGKSALYSPVLNSKVKRIVNSFQEAYFSNDQFAKISAVNQSRADEAKAIQIATDYYVNNKMKLYEPLTNAFMYAPIIGSVFLKVFWGEDKPIIEYINIKDIFFDPYAKNFDNVKFIVNNIYLTTQDIVTLQKNKIFKNDFDPKIIKATTTNRGIFERHKLQDIYILKEDKWTLYTLFENTIIREEKVLTDSHPFVMGLLQPQVESIYNADDEVMVYGDPVISASLSLQNEANIRKNQQIDAIARMLNPKIIIGKNSDINPLDLLHPTKSVRANDPHAINVIPQPNLQSAIFDSKELENSISENIGVSAQSNGVAPQRNMTATESSIVSNEGNMRLQSYIRSFNETLIEPMMRRIALLIWKYADAQFFIGVDRTRDFDFTAKVNTGLGATNKEIQANGIEKTFQMIGALANLAGAGQDGETIKECIQASRLLVREALPLHGIADVENYFKEFRDGRNTLSSGEATGNQSSI